MIWVMAQFLVGDVNEKKMPNAILGLYVYRISRTVRTWKIQLGKGAKKRKTKLTSVSFMYAGVAGNGEMLFFFSFFPPTIV